MEELELQEKVLGAWISLNSLLKDSQMTQSLTYNEAIVMKLVYDQYRAEPEGRTAVQYLLKCTKLLKSLMNRTINSLCEMGFLVKSKEGRNLYVAIVPEKLPDFLKVHARSLGIVQSVIDIIGEEDASEFARICEKLISAGLTLER